MPAPTIACRHADRHRVFGRLRGNCKRPFRVSGWPVQLSHIRRETGVCRNIHKKKERLTLLTDTTVLPAPRVFALINEAEARICGRLKDGNLSLQLGIRHQILIPNHHQQNRQNRHDHGGRNHANQPGLAATAAGTRTGATASGSDNTTLLCSTSAAPARTSRAHSWQSKKCSSNCSRDSGVSSPSRYFSAAIRRIDSLWSMSGSMSFVWIVNKQDKSFHNVSPPPCPLCRSACSSNRPL